MGKVAQVLITGYWPDRVPRRTPIPQHPLSKQLDQAAGRVEAGAAAIIAPDRTVTYSEFYEDAKAIAAQLIARTEVRSTVALLGSSLPELLALTVAGQMAGCKVALVEPAAPESVKEQLASLAPDLVVICSGAERPAGAIAAVVSLQELRQPGLEGKGVSERRARWRDIAILLPFRGGFAGHNHAGVTAMTKALTTYIPALESSHFVCSGPLHRWDVFACAITALLCGKAIVLDTTEVAGWSAGDAYGVLSREQAEAIVKAGKAPRHLSQLRLLFVVMSHFEVKWRRRLEAILKRIVLPLWGTPQTGPAILAHPSWAPVEVHGLPLTNVTLVPIDPANGEPSEVPWEMLDRAELGIESPSVQMKDKEKDDALSRAIFEWKGNSLARTGKIVEVDRLGMVRFIDAH